MDVKHPKRKKDKQNPYTLSIENGKEYISFHDTEGTYHKIEVTHALFSQFNDFELEDISYLNVVSRHYEFSELTESTLNERAFLPQESMEDTVFRKLQNAQLYAAIQTLPKKQRNRLILYYFRNYTYAQIAEMEGCTVMPVKRSIDKAIAQLGKLLK
ncbi:MAG: RNA polymerase sigma factor [Blautia sp.]